MLVLLHLVSVPALGIQLVQGVGGWSSISAGRLNHQDEAGWPDPVDANYEN